MKALVLFSGGVDSTTALALAIQEHGKDNVVALSISYGQKHTKEIEAANKIAQFYQVEHLYLDLAKIFTYSNCSLLQHSDNEIPHESYNEQLIKQMAILFLLMCLLEMGLFLSSAASIALSKSCNIIYYGAHSDDAAGSAYPDCSKVFNNAMNQAIYEGSGHQLEIKAPFVEMTKADIVKIGLSLGVPYQLTWSCYEGNDTPCGTCGTCIDRQNAFLKNGIKDPLLGE